MGIVIALIAIYSITKLAFSYKMCSVKVEKDFRSKYNLYPAYTFSAKSFFIDKWITFVKKRYK